MILPRQPSSVTVNGVLVSDFYTPHFFDPVKNASVRYSFTGAIDKPRQVLRGGYISWHNPPTTHANEDVFPQGRKRPWRYDLSTTRTLPLDVLAKWICI